MANVAVVTLPLFALVLVGWIASRTGVLPQGSVPGLNAFVLYFSLPCMLMRFAMATPLARLLDPTAALVYGAVACAMVALAMLTLRRAKASMRDASFGALVTAFPNTGFMGVPLVTASMGPTAIGPLVCALVVDLVFTSSVCLALASRDERAGRRPRATTASIVVSAASNPLPWAIAVGAALSAARIALPHPLDTLTAMLAAAATPVALFAIGAALASRNGGGDGAAKSGVVVATLSMLKLGAHPLLVALAGRIAISIGAPLSENALGALVLVAALPSAGNVLMLAERNGADGSRIARITLVTTVLAVATFTAIAAHIVVLA